MGRSTQAASSRLSASSASTDPIANELVAAGDGAFRTWSTRGPTAEGEVVDQRAVAGERLRTHAGGPERDMVHAQARHVPLELADECRLRPVAPQLGDPGREVAAGEAEETAVGEGSQQVACIDVPAAVSLAREREDRVGAGDDRPVDALREVHAKEREPRIRHRVDEAATSALASGESV